MNLTFDQIRAATAGAVDVIRDADGIHFYRFTREQLGLCRDVVGQEQIKNYEKKLLASAGIKLHFRTDSTTLQLRMMLTPGSGRSYYSVDITVDGRLIGTLDNFSPEELKENYAEDVYEMEEGERWFSLGDGMKTVCIHFPWSFCAVLQELRIEDGAVFEPAIPPKKLLVFGDSITQGYDALRPSNRYIARLAEALGAQEFNKAIGGAIVFPQLAEKPEAFLPDYIVSAYGTNDWNYSTVRRFCTDYRTFLACLRKHYPKTPVLVLTPVWCTYARREGALGAFSEMERYIREIAGNFSDVHVISCTDAIPHEERFFGDLRLHPNDDGFACYFKHLQLNWKELSRK